MHFVDRTSRGLYERLVSDAAGRVTRHLATVERPTTNSPRSQLSNRVAAVDLDDSPKEPELVLAEIDELFLSEAVWFHTPGYLAHLNCPVEVTAVATEAILAAVNTSVDTYDQSRIGTFIERKVLDWAARRVGFDHGDGIFTSGGTQSNLHALLLARDHALAGFSGAERGERQQRLVVIASAESHFSVAKSARVLGLSDEAVIHVPTDASGRSSPDRFRMAIQIARSEGRTPFAIVATAGTTDRGIVDPLREVADIAIEADVWLHVDAAYGGGLLVSSKYGHRLAGIESARSVTVDFHKMFFQPVSSSALLLRDGRDFHALKWHADYLNPEDSDEPNQVDKSLQTTRRFDALKLFATLRATGVVGLGDAVDRLIELTQDVHASVEEHSELTLVSPTDLTTVLFRWQPIGVSDAHADSLVSPVRARLQSEGAVLIAKTRINGRPAFKLTLLNPTLTVAQVGAALEVVAQRARDVYALQAAEEGASFGSEGPRQGAQQLTA